MGVHVWIIHPLQIIVLATLGNTPHNTAGSRVHFSSWRMIEGQGNGETHVAALLPHLSLLLLVLRFLGLLLHRDSPGDDGSLEGRQTQNNKRRMRYSRFPAQGHMGGHGELEQTTPAPSGMTTNPSLTGKHSTGKDVRDKERKTSTATHSALEGLLRVLQ